MGKFRSDHGDGAPHRFVQGAIEVAIYRVDPTPGYHATERQLHTREPVWPTMTDSTASAWGRHTVSSPQAELSRSLPDLPACHAGAASY